MDRRNRCVDLRRHGRMDRHATDLTYLSSASWTGKALGRIVLSAESGALRSPPVWATLNTRSRRPRPTIDRHQEVVVANRLANPLRKPRWTNIHTSQAGKPLSWSPRKLQMDRQRPMVATLPTSR